MKYFPSILPACDCSLCRRRQGLPTPYVEPVVYSAPRKRGEPCGCNHCKALRAEVVL
jgi:hypothetical protein